MLATYVRFIQLRLGPQWCGDLEWTMALWSTQPLIETSKGGWFVGLTTLPPSFVECLEIWEPKPPVTLGAYVRIALHLFHCISDTCLVFSLHLQGC